MYTIEFETQGKGRYLELPFTLPAGKNINVRVILITEQNIEALAAPKKYGLTKLTTFKKGRKITDFVRNDAYYDEI
jgi:hypothetical protein